MADGIKARIAGTWEDLTPNIKVGGSWVTPDKVHIRVGGSWIEVWVNGPTVIVNPLKTIGDVAPGGTAYAYFGVFADGDLYSSKTGTTPNVSYETWLDGGSNTQVWVERTINSGTLDTDWGASRVACTSDRVLGVSASGGATQACNVTVDFYDAASGGTLLDSQTLILDADSSGA